MPFRRKLMPAAFPVFTTISWAARTEVWAGAIRVSWATSLPSAVRETQVVFSARTCKVKVLGGFAAASGAATGATAGDAASLAGGLGPGWGGLAGGLLTEAAEDVAGVAAGDAAGESWFAGEVDAVAAGGAVFASGAGGAEVVAAGRVS